jgi:hypothetical protein
MIDLFEKKKKKTKKNQWAPTTVFFLLVSAKLERHWKGNKIKPSCFEALWIDDPSSYPMQSPL